MIKPVTDTDLPIKRGGGGGGVLKKIFFGLLGLSLAENKEGEHAPPLDPSL